MIPDRPPIPAEQEALDRPWRVWASVAIGAFTLVSIALGFVILPEGEEPGLDPFAAICRAIGIPGFERTDTSAAAAAAPAAAASEVAWTAATRDLLANADVERGASLVTETCASCHGEDGIGIDPSFPNLANQPAAALFKQLRDYKSESRQGGQADVMTPMAQGLDETQMADVAAYYALRDPRDRIAAGSAVRLAIERLATIGDPTRAMAPCDSCHGASQSGLEGAPVLLGQSAPYLEQQLQLFASGERDNDLFARMRTIARQLTPEEIHGLAIYYGGNPLPRYRN
jgi:cytochrome c553